MIVTTTSSLLEATTIDATEEPSLEEMSERISHNSTSVMPAVYYYASIENAKQSNGTTAATTIVSPTSSSALSEPMLSSGSENRLRWVDFRRPSVYPPRMPQVQGIPSGFRNPLSPNPSTANIGVPHHPTGFGGSSTQPVGFGGSVVMSNHYPPQSGSARRPHYNITRVEREL